MNRFTIDADATPKYKVELQDAFFNIRRRIVPENILKQIKQHFSKGKKVLYILNTYQVRSVQVSKGTTTLVSPSLYYGSIPDIIYIGIVSAEAFHRKLDKIPFNFKDNSLSKIILTANDEPVVFRSIEFSF
jgi:hypothetical protein